MCIRDRRKEMMSRKHNHNYSITLKKDCHIRIHSPSSKHQAIQVITGLHALQAALRDTLHTQKAPCDDHDTKLCLPVRTIMFISVILWLVATYLVLLYV